MVNSKKKMLITFGIMLAIILALVTTIVVVLAFTQQTIRTSLNISYTTVEVDGSVQATYTIGNTTNYLTRSDGLGTKIEFHAEDTSDQNASLVFPTDEIKLTSTNKSILLTYMFTNTGSNVYTAIMSLDELKSENMTLEYSLDNSTFSENQYALVVRNTGVSYYYVRISITNLAHNASFSGELNWLLENYEPTGDETYIPVTQTSYNENADGTYTAIYNGSPLTGNKLIVPSSVGSIKVTKFEIPADTSANKLPENTTLVISEGITEIIDNGNSAGLVSISIPASLNTITSSTPVTFRSCNNLAEIKVAAGNTTYASSGNCLIEKSSETLLAGSIKCEIPRDGSVTTIASGAFYGRNNPYLYVPASVTSIPNDTNPSVFPSDTRCIVYCEAETKPNGWNLTDSIQESSKTEFKYGYTYEEFLDLFETLGELAMNNPDFEFEGTTVTGYRGDESVVVVPEGTVAIAANAFTSDTITKVIIPEGVVTIGDDATASQATVSSNANQTFGPGLREIVFTGRSNLTSVKSDLFSYSPNLSKITMEEPGVKYHATSNCLIETATKTLVAGGSSAVIPSDGSVTIIANGAFYGRNSMTGLWIPNQITTISDNTAFADNMVIYCEVETKPEGWNISAGVTFEYAHTHTYNSDPFYEVVTEGQTKIARSWHECSCGMDDTHTIVNNAVIVTPETAQMALDGKIVKRNGIFVVTEKETNESYVNINDKVIVFDEGEYGKLEVRPTKETAKVYTSSYPTTISQVTGELDINSFYTYVRDFTNLTFVGTENATFKDLFLVRTGHITNSGFLGDEYNDIIKNDNSYGKYISHMSIDNLTISRLNFSGARGRIFINNGLSKCTINNININNCTLITNTPGSDAGVLQNNAAVFITANKNNVFGTINFTNNKVDGHYQGVYTQNADVVNIKNNEISNTVHNGIAAKSGGEAFIGTINILNNTVYNTGDRAVRFGKCTNSQINVENNVFKNSVDADNELLKSEALTNTNYSFKNNTYNGELLDEITDSATPFLVTITTQE